VKTRIVAIVPMRHESERVPGKNYRRLGDRPLFHHIVETLLATPRIAEIVIDTDSELIRDDARQAFPSVTVVERPKELRGGMVSMNDVLLNDVRRIDSDLYLQTHSTNPLLREASISRAIDEFLAADPEPDSLFGVTRLQSRLWDANGSPLNHDPRRLRRTQDLAPLFEENSCLYLFSRQGLEEHGSRIGSRPMMFELPRDESWDIDDETDFRIAEALYELRLGA
jgi:CMP-N-acetylneuraminic acid synthetase